MKPLLSVIIVSFNTREMTLRCLDTLFDALGELNAEVWVVDNASSDGSAAAIRAAFPAVQLTENAKNLGFGAANNAAMQHARGDFLLLLNSDAFVQTGALEVLLNAMERHPRAGVVGPKLLNRDGTLQRSCWRFPSPSQAWSENLGLSALLPNHPKWGDYRRWNHEGERAVDFVIGACLLVRRQVWDKIGGFDPAFWMYAEETDWQKRMTQNDWEIWFCPAAHVEHWGGASGAQNEGAELQNRVAEAFFASLDRYERKHHGFLGFLSLRAAMLTGNALRLPLWCGVWLWKPSQRARARAKIGLIVRLLKRQSTHWRMNSQP